MKQYQNTRWSWKQNRIFLRHKPAAKRIIIGDSDNKDNNDDNNVDHTCHQRTKQTNGASRRITRIHIFFGAWMHIYFHQHYKFSFFSFCICLHFYPRDSHCMQTSIAFYFCYCSICKRHPHKEIVLQYICKRHCHKETVLGIYQPLRF